MIAESVTVQTVYKYNIQDRPDEIAVYVEFSCQLQLSIELQFSFHSFTVYEYVPPRSNVVRYLELRACAGYLS